MVRRMSAKEARNSFSDLLGIVYYSKEAVVVEKWGRPVAVIITPEDYERLLRQREERFAVFDEVRAVNLEAAPQEVAADTAREIAALRKERIQKARRS